MPWKIPVESSEILLYLICRKFALSCWALCKNWEGSGHGVRSVECIASLLKNAAVSACVLSLVCIISSGVAAVETRCLATGVLPSAEDDSCAGGQETLGDRWAAGDRKLSKDLVICEQSLERHGLEGQSFLSSVQVKWQDGLLSLQRMSP